MTDNLDSVSRTLPRTWEDQLAEWSLRTGITVELWALPRQPLPAPVNDLIHGLVFDVLEEVKRQGHARVIGIALTVSSSGLRLTVSDNGLGMSVELYEVQLGGRRAELAKLGGRLTVNAVEGEGTTVSVGVPRRALG
jgi:signal transduction histidine kinase